MYVTEYGDGNVALIRVFNRALTSGEVVSLYNNGNPFPAPSTFSTSITRGPNEGATVCGSGATFAFTGTSTNTPTASLKYQYRVDGGAFSAPAASATATLTGLADGAHTFQVAAVDQYGYADPNPATRHFTIDGTLPVISNVQSGGANDSSVGIVWTTNKAATSQVKYRVVGAANFDGNGLNTSAVTAHQAFLSGLKPNTNYEFYVISQGRLRQYGRHVHCPENVPDFAGHDPAGCRVHGCACQWRFRRAGQCRFSSGQAMTTPRPTAALRFNINSMAARGLPPFSSAITTVTLNFPTIAPNAHTFTVRAYDAGGNVSAPASVTFTVDGTAPIFTALTASAVTFNSAQINWDDRQAHHRTGSVRRGQWQF